MEPIVMSWSGGKDSCMALHELQQSEEHRAVALMTTITEDYDRISMHGVRRELLQRQAESLGLPLHEVSIPAVATNEVYENVMSEALGLHRDQGLATIAFGDLLLEDIRAYRDRLVERNGMRALYPVWGRDTEWFVRNFIARGFKAVITCVDTAVLDAAFAGRMIDADLLADLPAKVDPCGENGEYHSFVFDGPMFAQAVEFSIGERVMRGAFCFCDLEPAQLCTPQTEATERSPC